jgi:hypothetical protein
MGLFRICAYWPLRPRWSAKERAAKGIRVFIRSGCSFLKIRERGYARPCESGGPARAAITPNTEVQTGRRPAVSGRWMTTSQPKKTSIGKVYHFSVLVFFAGAVGGKREASGILHSFRVVAYFSDSARRSVGV